MGLFLVKDKVAGFASLHVASVECENAGYILDVLEITAVNFKEEDPLGLLVDGHVSTKG